MRPLLARLLLLLLLAPVLLVHRLPHTFSALAWPPAFVAALMGGETSRMAADPNADRPAAWPPADFDDTKQKLATFAGGCFWSVELAYQRQPGVLKTAVGYTAGGTANPSYDAVCSGSTGHTEAVQLIYDPNEVGYQQLVDVLHSRIDPTAVNRQGNDVGTQYRSGIYWHDPYQQQVAQAYKAGIPRCAVEVREAGRFWPAENYHQQYLSKGGRNGNAQSAAKGCKDKIRCYG